MLEHGKSALVAATIAGAMGLQGPSVAPAGERFQEPFEVIRGTSSEGGKCTPIEPPPGKRLMLDHLSMQVVAAAADRSPNAYLHVAVNRPAVDGSVYLRPELVDRDVGDLGLHLWSGRWEGPLAVAPNDTSLSLCASGMVKSVRAIVVGTLEPL